MGEDSSSLKPVSVDTPNPGRWHDEAYKDGFNITHLEQLVSDCQDQPGWRERSDVAAAYIDGKQLTDVQQAALTAEGMPEVRPTNLIGRVVRGILGQEAKSRTDIKVEADDDESQDMCEVFNPQIKEAQRETYADMAVSNAYAGQVGPGIGWVEVGRNADPLDYPYRVKDVHRSEMYWDWRAQDLLLRDARWVCRKRWQDLDELEAAMPQHRTLLKQVSNGWAGFGFDDMTDGERAYLTPYFEAGSRYGNYARRMDWYEGARKRVKLYEVWYKVPAMGVVLHLSPTRRVLFDANNMAHRQAVTSGSVQITKSLTRQVRMALYAGPYRLQDVGTTRRNFPYVPFFAYRDDADLSPYGLVEGMISPQDEYNARRLRINWLLRARQITIDNDALDTKANTLSEVADGIMRPDLTVVLNASRTNADAFRVSNSLALQKEQVDVMQDAKQLIQDVPGVYGSQLGQAQSGVTSGIANSLLIEQGAVAMGDLNDNYRYSRRLVFENLLELIVEDHSAANMQVAIGRGSARRVVVLNAWDPQTSSVVNNVKDAPMRVGLGEVPNTPAFRMQQQQQIAGIINAMAQNPKAVAVLTPSFIEATDLPNRMELADDIRRASGLPTAGDKAAQEAMQQQATEDAKRQQALMEQAAQLELEDKAAKVQETQSKTALNQAKTVEIGHDMAMEGVAQAAANQPEAPDPEAERNRLIQESLQEALAA